MMHGPSNIMMEHAAHFPFINRDEAQRLLNIVDNRTDRFTFQMFDDDGDRKDGRLARTFHGTLDKNFSTLVTSPAMALGYSSR